MTLPVFLTGQPLSDCEAGGQLELGDEVASHAVRVRRMGPGERLDVIDGQGTRVRGSIIAADQEHLTLAVDWVAAEAVLTPRLTLVQALAKGERDLSAIEAATEVGVDAVVPWAATRSIADWPVKKQVKMAAKWRHTLVAATLQSRRSRIPELRELLKGNRLETVCQPGVLVLILHESATVPLRQAVSELRDGECEEIALVVGPEGGITDEEIGRAAAAGAVPVILGDTVLRASSAGPVGLAITQTLLGRWG